MTARNSIADYGDEIDRRLEAALAAADTARIPVARAAIADCEDRWYGQLLLRTHDSLVEAPVGGSSLSAAAAVELLRGYCRLRAELVVGGATGNTHSSRGDASAALLAGDFLYSAAYSTLGAADHPSLENCFETMSSVSGGIAERFGRHYDRTASSSTHCGKLIDGTSGDLGECAVVIGATLAGVDRPRRDDFASLGRGLGAGRQLDRVIDPGSRTLRFDHLEPDERAMRRLAERRLDEATDALREVSAVADEDLFRPLLEDIEADDE